MQPLRYAISFIIFRNEKEFLIVKRPKEDKELGAVWGLPATGFDPKEESPDEAVLRGAHEKLGCEVSIEKRLPLAMIQEREGYDLMLIDYICKLKTGEPDVKAAKTTGTKYTEQKWTSDPSILREAAEKGSICTQLFLHYIGLWPSEKFVAKL